MLKRPVALRVGRPVVEDVVALAPGPEGEDVLGGARHEGQLGRAEADAAGLALAGRASPLARWRISRVARP